MKIEHFAFEVSDLKTAIDFYVNKLGFEVKFTFEDPGEHETLAVLAVDGGKLELIQVLDANNQPKTFTPAPVREHFCPHIALQVENFERTLAQVQSQGLRIIHGPLEIPGLVKWMYICDPDNNVIEFFQEFEQN